MDAMLRQDADYIINQSIAAVMPDQAVKAALAGKTFPGRVILVAAGKAAWRMAKAAYDVMGERISEGIDKISGHILKIKGGYRLTQNDLEMINRYLPEMEYIYAATRVTDISNKTVEQLKHLKELGLREISLGVESGDDWTLDRVNNIF